MRRGRSYDLETNRAFCEEKRSQSLNIKKIYILKKVFIRIIGCQVGSKLCDKILHCWLTFPTLCQGQLRG